MKLDLIPVSDYLELIDKSKYNFAMKYVYIFTNAEDLLQMGDFINKPFGLVKDLQHDMAKGLTFDKELHYLSTSSGVPVDELLKMQLDDVSRCIHYMIDSIRNIINIEREALKHDPSDIEKQAGLERFDPLGVYMQIRNLTGGDVTKNKAIRELSYSHCFNELYARKQLSDFKDDCEEIIRSRNRNN